MTGRTVLVAVCCCATGLLAVGCRDTGRDGALFEIAGKLFVFNYRVATATYLVNLKQVSPLPDGLIAVASFEDPAGGGPIIVKQKIWSRLDKTTLESPPVRCIYKGVRYHVSISIEGADGAVRQTIETTLTSNADQSVLPDKPLVVGPAYTPNPDLAGRPSGKLDVTNEADCPPRPVPG
jgi:hypothetical protein